MERDLLEMNKLGKGKRRLAQLDKVDPERAPAGFNTLP